MVFNLVEDKEISKTIEGMGECIYDGELIEYEGKIRYLIFDCFYYGGVDKRDLPLYDKVGGKYVINDKSRIHYIKELMKVVTNEILSDELAIEEKVYYPMNKINRFFKQLVQMDISYYHMQIPMSSPYNPLHLFAGSYYSP